METPSKTPPYNPPDTKGAEPKPPTTRWEWHGGWRPIGNVDLVLLKEAAIPNPALRRQTKSHQTSHGEKRTTRRNQSENDEIAEVLYIRSHVARETKHRVNGGLSTGKDAQRSKRDTSDQ